MPGDWATVEADGSITLLGRGSVCINTGGEKVFPEEVEEVLKLHEAINDAVVVGVPSERFGQTIIAVVEPVAGLDLDGDGLPDLHAVVAHCHSHLAGYKAPTSVLYVKTIGRAANGKVDYKRHTTYALETLGLSE
jgi:fatty-acyl-CoA synthase